MSDVLAHANPNHGMSDVLAHATPAGLNDASIGVYARLRPGGEAGTEVEVKRKAGEQRHVQVLLTCLEHV